MQLVLPPGITERVFEQALDDFRAVLGNEWVFATDQDRETYLDHFATDISAHVSAAAVAPISVEEIQAIVRIANERKIPLWPISRGKNFGYGSAAPVLSGSVVLDLSRMKKIEMDVDKGTVLLEPGVGFYDLFDYVEANDVPYWISPIGNSWGSVAGNALDRGVGYTPYGDHAARINGMEVILPDGDLVRTGMGAMSNSPSWQIHPYGFGPHWDQMFVQSNFGIVTKLGMWLMPEPESIVRLDMELDKADDLGWAIDTLAPMRRSGLLQQSPSLGNWLRAAAVLTERDEWYDRPGALPDEVIDAIRARFGLGWWSVNLRLYGHADITRATAKVIKDSFAARTSYAMREGFWTTGMPREVEPFAGVPITFPLANAGWHRGRGAHLGFSPALPQDGDLALAQFHRTYARYREFGMDYHGSFALGERHITNVNQVLFDRDDAGMVKRVDQFFRALVDDARQQGYGEYRAHIQYMDLISDSYNFNDHALRRLNEKVKNALDPNGILAPGKTGIWPEAYKGGRA
ncbi:MAG: FAD-dependent oxidoreductase [Pseudomonadales bacterium]|nr:FAD-dependent oxidoreductase [Pseudomonadales bacterium]